MIKNHFLLRNNYVTFFKLFFKAKKNVPVVPEGKSVSVVERSGPKKVEHVSVPVKRNTVPNRPLNSKSVEPTGS